jgi:exopolysaccharide production protein ExoQ
MIIKSEKFKFWVFGIFFYSNALVPLLYSHYYSTDQLVLNSGESENFLAKIFFLFFLSGVILYYRDFVIYFISNKLYSDLFFWFIVLNFCSIFWSQNVFFSLKRFLGFLLGYFFAIQLVKKFNKDQIMEILLIVFFFVGVLSLIFSFFIDDLGKMTSETDGGIYEGVWRGVFTHKNSLGQFAGLALIFSIFVFKPKLTNFILTTVFLILLIFSQSTTAILNTIIILIIFILYYLFRFFKFIFYLVSLLVIVFTGIYGLSNFEDILNFFGKDITLTGRIFLWTSVIPAISDKPLLGHGFNGFWGGPNSPSENVLSELTWEAPHSHNLFLDILLQFGFVGLIIWLLISFKAIKFSISNLISFNNKFHLFSVGFFLYFFFYSFLESNLISSRSLYWVIFAVVYNVNLKDNEKS